MSYEGFVGGLTRVVEGVGVTVLIVGGLVAAWRFLLGWRERGIDLAYHRLRANLGRAILLGLEILIVADIIRSVAVEPTMENLWVLALLVVIRTFLSFALEIEISGNVPWRRGPEDAPHQGPERRSRSRPEE
jgi:uncharacterized membrane protein